MHSPEEKAESTLDALDGLRRATMPGPLAARIAASLATLPQRVSSRRVPLVLCWTAAAGIVLLIGANLAVLTSSNRPESAPPRIAGENVLRHEYFNYDNDF